MAHLAAQVGHTDPVADSPPASDICQEFDKQSAPVKTMYQGAQSRQRLSPHAGAYCYPSFFLLFVLFSKTFTICRKLDNG